MSVKVKGYMPTRTQVLEEARHKRMYEQAKYEMFTSPEDSELEETGEYDKARISLMRNAETSYGIDEYVPHKNFKKNIQKRWKKLSDTPDYELENQVLSLMRQTAAVSVEYVTVKLWMVFPYSFSQVRDALLRLEKLYLVEYHAGSYSYRNNILGR